MRPLLHQVVAYYLYFFEIGIFLFSILKDDVISYMSLSHVELNYFALLIDDTLHSIASFIKYCMPHLLIIAEYY